MKFYGDITLYLIMDDCEKTLTYVVNLILQVHEHNQDQIREVVLYGPAGDVLSHSTFSLA